MSDQLAIRSVNYGVVPAMGEETFTIHATLVATYRGKIRQLQGSMICGSARRHLVAPEEESAKEKSLGKKKGEAQKRNLEGRQIAVRRRTRFGCRRGPPPSGFRKAKAVN